ncbi:L,D-transpeptidase [Luteimonas salinilitoris]|uniref:L,D-transpeptidase n=1 Tax=Luteimonas salinilitoris TaxID=3237697 RepID=A0ABV4HRY1_9GAMM
MFRLIVLLCGLLPTAFAAHANVPFWGAKESSPADAAPESLKPGEFVWDAAAAPQGPMVMVVSLDEQRAYVYRNGVLIGLSTVSTGRRGHETPTGVFTILQKDKDHRSTIYNSAPMPYMERLTWGGIALHAGGLPGYPESHGCVHLPSEFARELFDVTPMGMTVVIARDGEAPAAVAHPALLTPVDAGGAARDQPRLTADLPFRWQPELAESGPLSIVLSAADRRLVVYRNGVEIGSARIDIRDPARPLGTHAFIVKQPVAARSAPTWLAVGIPGHMVDAGAPLDPAAADRVVVPPAFVAAVTPLLAPGTTLLVTDAPILEHSTGVDLQVVNADPPEA